jgi:hypothetical protein
MIGWLRRYSGKHALMLISDCSSRKTGCVAVKHRKVLSGVSTRSPIIFRLTFQLMR